MLNEALEPSEVIRELLLKHSDNLEFYKWEKTEADVGELALNCWFKSSDRFTQISSECSDCPSLQKEVRV